MVNENYPKVFISGVIGNDYNEDGTIKAKGVELVDVMESVAALGEVEGINFYINSPGGNVNVGNSIGDFIASIPNACTIATEQCASIATRIHTSVPLQNRFIEEGCQYMIHNPWGEVKGDAKYLKDVSAQFEAVEKELESHYAKATGTSKEALSMLMDMDTFFTADQCLKFNFASAVIPKPTLRAVAILQTTKQNKGMTTFSKRIANAMLVLKGEADISTIDPTPNARNSAKAAMLVTDAGTLETPFEDLQVGDSVMIDGAAAADGSYTISEGAFMALEGQMAEAGTVITIKDGMIESIEVVEVEPAADAEALNAKIAELEAKLEASEAEKAQLNTEMEAVAVQFENLAKISSNYTPPKAVAQFRQVNPAPKDGITKETLAERRAAYKTAKK